MNEIECQCPITGPETPVGGGDVETCPQSSVSVIETAPPTGLLEEGRRLASERDDLIAAGVDPAELLIPLAPASATEDERES